MPISDEGGEAELAMLAQCRDALTLALAAWVAGAVFRLFDQRNPTVSIVERRTQTG